ncbi:MAG: hypothetical protein MN733_35225 [Nitrososphaera sp.]|nr:hypothetical protein [Nitrososphaera sp.]
MLQPDYTVWASLGIIVGQVKGGTLSVDTEPPYRWFTQPPTDSVRAAQVDNFVNVVSESNSGCLLIGQAAEELSYKGIPPRCVLMTTENIHHDGVIVGSWEQPVEAFKSIFKGATLAKEESDKLLPRWHTYVNLVSEVTDTHKDSILYIPAICTRESEATLVGGLVWCVRRNRLNEALSELAHGQLMLRWALSELLAAVPELGTPVVSHSVRMRDEIKRNCYFTDAHPWYKHDHGDIDHDKVLRWLRTHLPGIDRYPKLLHNALQIIKEPPTGEITPALLYILALSAVTYKGGHIIWQDVPELAYASKYPFRNQIGKYGYRTRIQDEFFWFIVASVMQKGTSKQIIESISVEASRIIIITNDAGYAKGLQSKISETFEVDVKDNLHNTSGPLSRFILWSGSDFVHNDTTISGVTAHVKVYNESGRSVVKIEGARTS